MQQPSAKKQRFEYPIRTSVRVAMRGISDKLESRGIQRPDGIPEIMLRVSGFIDDEVDPYVIVKYGFVHWCKYDANRLVDKPEYQRRFVDAFQTLTVYDKVDRRVLDYCVSAYVRNAAWREIAIVDPSEAELPNRHDITLAYVAHAVVAGGNVDVVDWMLRHVTGQADNACLRAAMRYLAKAEKQWFVWFLLTDSISMPDELDYGCVNLDLTDQPYIDHLNAEYYVRSATSVVGGGDDIEVDLAFQRPIGSDIRAVKDYEYSTSKMLTSHTADKVAARGLLDLLQWMYVKGATCSQAGIDKAAGQGHLDVVQWLYAGGMTPTVYGVVAAIAMHRDAVVRWLYEKDLVDAVPTLLSLLCVVRSRNIDGLRTLHGTVQDTDSESDEDVEMGPDEQVHWTCELTVRIDPDAATRMLIDYTPTCRVVATYVLAPKTPVDRASMDGDLPLVRSLYAQGHTCSEIGLDAAAARGHLAVVQWLHGQKCTSVLSGVVAGAQGHADIARFLDDSGGHISMARTIRDMLDSV